MASPPSVFAIQLESVLIHTGGYDEKDQGWKDLDLKPEFFVSEGKKYYVAHGAREFVASLKAKYPKARIIFYSSFPESVKNEIMSKLGLQKGSGVQPLSFPSQRFEEIITAALSSGSPDDVKLINDLLHEIYLACPTTELTQLFKKQTSPRWNKDIVIIDGTLDYRNAYRLSDSIPGLLLHPFLSGPPYPASPFSEINGVTNPSASADHSVKRARQRMTHINGLAFVLGMIDAAFFPPNHSTREATPTELIALTQWHPDIKGEALMNDTRFNEAVLQRGERLMREVDPQFSLVRFQSGKVTCADVYRKAEGGEELFKMFSR